MKIAVAGTGYVGLSNAMLLAQHNEMIALDIVPEKVALLNNKQSPIAYAEVEDSLQNKPLNFRVTLSKEEVYLGAQFVVIATPTDYDPEAVIKDVMAINPIAMMVIISTIPVGYTQRIKEDMDYENLIFSREYIREGKGSYNNLYPSRIIVGERSKRAETFASLSKQGAVKQEIPVLFTDSIEAEAAKLFSNTYLALRVAYELDASCEIHDLDTKQITRGVGLYPQIGDYYNNVASAMVATACQKNQTTFGQLQ